MERLLTLSDGVVAIAITLLALQLNVPLPAKLHAPASASELAKFWLVHHRVFRQIAGQREGLAWWNFAFLFTITLMPFTSDLLGEYSANPLAVDIFAVNLLGATLATYLTLVYGRRQDLLTMETSARDTQAGQVRAAASVFVIVLSIGIAWVNTSAAKYCWLLLAVVPQVADRWSGRRLG